MTDELSIQPQIQQKSNALPYALGGAAIGGVGGYFTPMLQKSYSSYEDIINESEDTFKKQIEKGGDNKTAWETAKTHAEKINNAETEYNKLVEQVKTEGASVEKSLPADNAAAKKLEAAQKAYDAEMTKLVDAEKSKLNIGNGRVTEFPSRKTLQNELSSAEFKRFESFLNDYESARKTLLGNPGAKFAGGTAKSAYANINTQKKTVADMYKDIYNNNYAGLTDKEKAKFDPTKGKVGKKLTNTVDSLLPEKFGTSLVPGTGTRYSIPKYNYSEFKAFQDRFGAEMFEIADKNPGSTPGKGVFKVKNGGKDAWVIVDNAAVKAKRDALKAEYAENIKRAIDLQTQLGNVDKEFFKANEAVLKNDLKNPIKSAADLARLKKPSVYKKVLNSIEVIETSVEKGIQKYPFNISSEVIKNADELRVLKMQYQTEKEIAEKYVLEGTKITNELESIVRKDTRVDSAYKKMQQVIKEDKGVQNAIDAVERKLNGKYANDADKALYEKVKGLMKSEAAMTPEEITAKAKEAANKAIEGKDVAKALEAAKKEAATAAKDLGIKAELTGEELTKALKEKGLGTLEEYKSKLKEEAKKAIGEDLSKFKTPNKWANAAIGAAVLAAAGLGIAAATSKKNA